MIMDYKQILLILLHYCYIGDFADAYSEDIIRLNPEDVNYNIRELNKIDYTQSRNPDQSEFIGKILNIIKREQKGITTLEINKCLSKYAGYTKRKLNCIKRLLYKSDSAENDSDTKFIKDILKDKIHVPYEYKQDYESKGFIDLTKSLNNNVRSFHTISNFSQDYLDINDLLRTNPKMNDKAPSKIKKKGLYIFKLTPIKGQRRFRAMNPNEEYLKKNILRTISEESDISSSEESSPEVARKIKKSKAKPPKRFQVIDKSKESDDSNDSDDIKSDREDDKSDLPVIKPNDVSKNDRAVVLYMQGPTRVLKIKKESRRRLPHFFPKRYHWNEDDIKNLRNYWFSGVQGKYWGHFKTPY